MAKTILATYRQKDIAKKVIYDLMNTGIPRKNIGFAVYDRSGKFREGDFEAPPLNITTDLLPAIVFGAIGGFFVALVSGIEPFLMVSIMGIIFGAIITPGIVILTEQFRKEIMTETEAHYSAESLRRGAALVTVTTTEENREEAKTIMQRYRPVTNEERPKQWLKDRPFDDDSITEPYVAEERVTA